MRADSRLGVVLLYPDLLGTYGDRGNALALVHRARARGICAQVVEVHPGQPAPADGDVYLLGGGEDVAQVLAGEALRLDRDLGRALDGRAACLAVCAGFQLLSRRYADRSGRPRTGLGVLDVACGRLPPGARAVGEVVAGPVGLPDLPVLTGYENHQGDAALGPGARPLGRVVHGTGNGVGGLEGTVQGSVVGTYLHGPVLVRNPALADHLLQRSTGPLPALDDEVVERLRRERLAAAAREGARRRRAASLRQLLPGRAARGAASGAALGSAGGGARGSAR